MPGSSSMGILPSTDVPATDAVADVTIEIGKVQELAGAESFVSIPGRVNREARKTFRRDPSERPMRRRGFR
jgi:hypothetical protein